MCVGNFNRETLEELFIDGVEERLFLGEVFDSPGRLLDGTVKPVELL